MSVFLLRVSIVLLPPDHECVSVRGVHCDYSLRIMSVFLLGVSIVITPSGS